MLCTECVLSRHISTTNNWILRRCDDVSISFVAWEIGSYKSIYVKEVLVMPQHNGTVPPALVALHSDGFTQLPGVDEYLDTMRRQHPPSSET